MSKSEERRIKAMKDQEYKEAYQRGWERGRLVGIAEERGWHKEKETDNKKRWWEKDFEDFWYETGKYRNRELGIESYVEFIKGVEDMQKIVDANEKLVKELKDGKD